MGGSFLENFKFFKIFAFSILCIDFFRFSQSNSDLLHSLDAEISQEALEIKRFSYCGVYTV